MNNGNGKRTRVVYDFETIRISNHRKRYRVVAKKEFADGSTERVPIGTPPIRRKMDAIAFAAALNWAYDAGKEDAELPEDFFQADSETVSRIRRAFAQTEGIA